MPSSPWRRKPAAPPIERAFVMIAREPDSTSSESPKRMGGNARSRSMGVGAGGEVYWDNRFVVMSSVAGGGARGDGVEATPPVVWPAHPTTTLANAAAAVGDAGAADAAGVATIGMWGKTVDPPPLTPGGRILAAAVRGMDASRLSSSPEEAGRADAAGAPPSSIPSRSRSVALPTPTLYTVRQLRTRDWQRLLERIPKLRYRSPPLDALPGVPVILGALPGVAPRPASSARPGTERGGRETPVHPYGGGNGSTRSSARELPVTGIVAAPHLGVNSVRGVTFVAVLLPRWRLLPPELDRGFSLADAVAEEAVGGS